MGKKEENRHFTCIQCQKEVLPLQNGSFRNHCPFCLVSLHLDDLPGDRKSGCGGIMFAHRLVQKKAKGWQIIHRCQKCGHEQPNKIAENDPQPDSWEAIMQLCQGS